LISLARLLSETRKPNGFTKIEMLGTRKMPEDEHQKCSSRTLWEPDWYRLRIFMGMVRGKVTSTEVFPNVFHPSQAMKEGKKRLRRKN
jgi:hypothetical protein